MKKTLAAILIAILTLGLVACGSDSSSTSQETSQEDTSVQAAQDSSGESADTSADGSEELASSEKATIRLAVMTNNQSQWYALIGQDSGIFEKYGIELEITEFAAGINTVDAVVTQQADIGMLADYAAVNRIGNTAENTNLQFITRIATNDGKSETKLYVNPDKIKSLEDLAGAGFVTLPGTVWDYWTAKTYEAAGIEESNQNILNADSAASAVAILVNGEGDAFWASGTNAQKVAEAGFEPLISTEDLSLYTDQYFITTSDYVNENEAVVERFLQALQEIVQWTADNTDEAATIINQETGYDADQFKLDYEAVTLTIDFPQSTVDHLNDIKTWAVEKGSFNDYTIEDFVNTEPLKNAISGVDTFK